MKKLMIGAWLVFAASVGQAGVEWSWWLDKPNTTPELSFGLASRCKSVESLELSLVYSGSPVSKGAQLTVFGFNNADSVCALQMALLNRGKAPCVQLGFLNLNTSSVFDMGVVTISDNAKFQLGLLNFNKKGFLPVFPFVNFDPSIFD